MIRTKSGCINKVPSKFAQIGVIMKYTLLDYIRSRRFLILMALTLVMSVALAYFVGKGIFGLWGTFSPIFITLSVVFFGGDAISGEFQNKTGYFSVPNPISRSVIYIGKWLSAFIAACITFGVFAASITLTGLYYNAVPSEFGLSVLFAYFYLAAIVGFVFFVSSLFKSSTNAFIVDIVVLMLGFSIISQIAGMIPVEPWFSLSYGGSIMSTILQNPYPPNVTVNHFGSTTMTSYNPTVPEGLAIMAVYLIVTTVVGLIMFKRKEFN
ncbi:MAG: ABC transporter permease [Candidatus Bathyarchaeota archaeon]|nr:ABC transporter permease [Candidatus Bathyarchaeota archaeon]